MTAITDLLQVHPEVALFAALSLGFFLGKRKVGSFSLGTSPGVLLAGVLIGQLHIPIPPLLKAVSFALFIFVVGYRVGPQFFRGLRGEGLCLAAIALILAVTGLLTAYATAVLLGYDRGTAAGLLGGSLTQSAILGSADDAIARLDRGPEVKRLLSDNVSVAYAVTYLFGTAGGAWFLSRVGPRLLGVDLAAACASLGRGSGEDTPGESPARGPFLIRAYRIQGPPWAWSTVGEVEAAHSGRVLIERIRHRGRLLEADPGTLIHPRDTLAVAGDHEELFPLLRAIGEEVDDPELLAFPLETLPVVMTCKESDGRALEEVLQARGRGVSITKLTRAGREMPLSADRHVQCGDTLHLVGPKRHVERAAQAAGLRRPARGRRRHRIRHPGHRVRRFDWYPNPVAGWDIGGARRVGRNPPGGTGLWLAAIAPPEVRAFRCAGDVGVRGAGAAPVPGGCGHQFWAGICHRASRARRRVVTGGRGCDPGAVRGDVAGRATPVPRAAPRSAARGLRWGGRVLGCPGGAGGSGRKQGPGPGLQRGLRGRQYPADPGRSTLGRPDPLTCSWSHSSSCRNSSLWL